MAEIGGTWDPRFERAVTALDSSLDAGTDAVATASLGEA